MISLVKTFGRLPFQDQKIVLFLLVLIPCFEVLLRTIGFNRTAKFVWRPVSNTSSLLSDIETERRLRRYGRLLVKLRRLLPFGRCLAQSLALARLLQSAGISVELVFGQSRTDQKLVAHAWLEYQGVPVNEAESITQTYMPFRTPVLKAGTIF